MKSGRAKIRLAQIDAPEHDQHFGQKSKQPDMVFNKAIKVEKNRQKIWADGRQRPKM